ncbi:RHS repeat protein [Hymenobacter sp. BT664]|uniref:RHS repeat protein n=2 Tax=Hymenobacter montanus TaxID=2771359 RepID=A0A927BEF2_9BACT|nr:RHS repeat protein [Hymenobacter montanus]
MCAGILPISVSHGTSNSSVSIAPKTVQSITWAGGQALFFASERLANGTKLDSVRVQDFQGHLIKRFRFAYAQNSNSFHQLLLTQVQELAVGGQPGKPPYRFYYDSFTSQYEVTPQNEVFSADLNPYAIDYWGFCNGANNTSLLPERYVPVIGTPAFTLMPGDRAPNLAACRKWALTRMVYPTMGYTTFEYELNEYGFEEGRSLPSQVVLGPSHSVGLSTTCRYQAPGNTISCPGTGGTRTFRIPARQRIRVDWGSHSPFFTDQDGTEQGPRLTLQGPNSATRFGPFISRYVTGRNCNASGCTYTQYYDVEPGLYTLEASVAPPEIAGSAYISVTYRDSIGTSPNLPAGGLRIKRITDNPTGQPAREMSRIFSYTMAADPARSSGCLVSPLPTYYYNFQHDIPGMCDDTGGGGTGGNGSPGSFIIQYIKVYSTASLTQPGMTQGAFVGYREVTVTNVDDSNPGKSVYTFTSAYEYPDEGSSGFPYASRTSHDYQRGLLLRETHYKYTDGQYAPVTQTVNTYSRNSLSANIALLSLEGWKIGYSRHNEVSAPLDCFARNHIRYETGGLLLAQSEKRSFDNTGAAHVNTTRYQYGNPAFPHSTAVETITGAGQSTLLRHRYTFDYDTLSANSGNQMASVLRLLRRRHALLPLEEQMWRINGSDTTLVKATLTTFNAQFLPKATLQLQTTSPISSSTYLRSDIHNGLFSYDPRLTPETVFDQYDALGNLQQAHRVNGSPTSVLWGYQSTQPLAETQGATTRQTAFTSFEPDAPGRFSYDPEQGLNHHRVPGGRTGQWAYRLDGNRAISRDSLPPGTYELLFWARAPQRPSIYQNGTIEAEHLVAETPNGWRQFRLRLRFATLGSLSLDASSAMPVLVDEVRLHPVEAQMTSYTYDPLVGMTSQTTPDGRTTTYEYDGLGRLVRARDERGRVLSQQQYHYAGQ